MTAGPASDRLGIVSLALAAALGLTGCASDDDDDDVAEGDAAADGASEGDDDDDDDDAGSGSVSLRFEASSTVTGSMNLDDELVGAVYGAFYLAAEVGVTGPRDDAEQYGGVEVAELDLSSGDDAVSEVLFEAEGLPPGEYVFLGFFDVDDSSAGAEEQDPDPGDPVTLPTVNKFTIEAGQNVEVTIRFDLVFG